MHRGANFTTSIISSACSTAAVGDRKRAAAAMVLSSTQAGTLATALQDDAQDYCYSACVSIVDALRGVGCGFYTWATVKLYYSVFYSLRACLAVDGICAFHVGRTPFRLRAKAGQSVAKGNGTTHEYILRLFMAENPSHPFATQQIDLIPALDWIISQREQCNYSQPRFSEPDVPDRFKHVEAYGLRRLVTSYLDDSRSLYTFDKDHAMLALPLRALAHATTVAKGLGAVRLAAEELTMLSNECRDTHGQLSPLTALFRAFS